MEIPLAQIFYSISSFTGYTDITVGENSTRYFRKEFCYSVCGLPFSEWVSLTDQNVASIVVSNSDFYFFKFRYIHVYTGVPSTLSGTLEFTSIEIDHVDGTLPVNNDVFNNSIFSQFTEAYGYDTLLWSISVFEKIYQKGIVPTFITRGDANSIDDDRDYIDFWISICQLFAIIVVYSREFESFDSNEELLSEYLKQRSLLFCPDATLTTLDYLMSNYYRIIRQRGTKGIVREETISGVLYQGELLNFICKGTTDEFLLNITRNNDIGWTIERSSPLYKGLTHHHKFHKAFEDTQDFIDITAYKIHAVHGTVTIVTDGDKSALHITNVAFPITIDSDIITIDATDPTIDATFGDAAIDEFCGISDIANAQVPLTIDSEVITIDDTDTTIDATHTSSMYDVSHRIIIDPSLDYEITFWVNQKELGEYLYFGVNTYDENGDLILNKSMVDGSDSNVFMEYKVLNIVDTYYFVRGIIFNKDHALDSSTTNLGIGNNLKFADGTCRFMYPVIGAIGISVGIVDMMLWDVKIKPLSTNYSTGFIQLSNFLEFWIKNNNENLLYNTYGDSIEVPELEYDLRKFLLNYRNVFKIKYLPKEIVQDFTDNELLEVGDGTYLGDDSGLIGS